MSERPELNKELDGKTFRSFYYLDSAYYQLLEDRNLNMRKHYIDNLRWMLIVFPPDLFGTVYCMFNRKKCEMFTLGFIVFIMQSR